MKNFKFLSCTVFPLLLQLTVFAQTNSATMENNKIIADQFYSGVINTEVALEMGKKAGALIVQKVKTDGADNNEID